MADKDIVFKVSVDTEGGKSLKDLKTEFNEVSKELGKAKQGSEEYLKSLQKLGNIKDQIGDLRAEISGLTPEGKVQAFQNVASGLASGFQAATGAAALFGVQTGDVEKQLLKVQAVMAFTEGIKGITGLKDAFTVLNNVIRANPIIATVTAIAALTAGVFALTRQTKDLKEEQAQLKEINDNEIKTFDLRIAQAKEMGQSVASINNLIREQLKLKQEGLKTQAHLAAMEAAQMEQDLRKLGIRVIEFKSKQAQDEYDALNTQYQAKLQIVKGFYLDSELLAQKSSYETVKIKQDEIVKTEAIYDNHSKYIQDLIDEAKRKRAEQAEENSAQLQYELEQDLAALTDADAKGKANRDALRKQEEEEANARRKREEQAEKELAMAKETLYQNSWASAKLFSDAYFNYTLSRAKGNQKEEEKIRKRQFEVDKAFSIARGVIDGVRSVQAALTIPPPAGYILAAANAILAVANIAKIASTQFNAGSVASSGGGDISGPSMPSNSGPIITQAPTTITRQGTNLGPNGENLSRVYVVESDISEKQSRVAKLKEQATF